MNRKLLQVVGEFLDSHNFTKFDIEGYFTFCYVTVNVFDLQEKKNTSRTWYFNMSPEGEITIEEGEK